MIQIQVYFYLRFLLLSVWWHMCGGRFVAFPRRFSDALTFLAAFLCGGSAIVAVLIEVVDVRRVALM